MGTLLFTILVFIATTTMVFFVFFLLVRAGVLACLALLKAPVIAVHALPLATLAVRLCRPRFFADGMQLEPLLIGTGDGLAHSKTVEVTIRSVGVGTSATDDRRHRRAIQDAVAALDDADCGADATVSTMTPVVEAADCAYFQLKPIAVSAGTLLARKRTVFAR